MSKETDKLIENLNLLEKGNITVPLFLQNVKDLLTNKNTDLKATDTVDSSKATCLHHLTKRNQTSKEHPDGITYKQMETVLKRDKTLVNIKDAKGRIPFQLFLDELAGNKWTVSGYQKTLNLFVTAGTNLTVKDASEEENTLLHLLIVNNKIPQKAKPKVGVYDATIFNLLKNNKNLVKLTNKQNLTPLQLLMKQRAENKCEFEEFRKLAKLLLKAQTDLSEDLQSEMIHLLVQGNSTGSAKSDINKLLKKNESLVNRKNTEGLTLVQVLMNQLSAKAYTPEKFREMLMILAANGADLLVLDTIEGSARTVLHWLIEGNQTGEAKDAITEILKSNLKIAEMKDSQGLTPLEFLKTRISAAKWSQQEVEKTSKLLSKRLSVSPLKKIENNPTSEIRNSEIIISNPLILKPVEEQTTPTLEKTKSLKKLNSKSQIFDKGEVLEVISKEPAVKSDNDTAEKNTIPPLKPPSLTDNQQEAGTQQKTGTQQKAPARHKRLKPPSNPKDDELTQKNTSGIEELNADLPPAQQDEGSSTPVPTDIEEIFNKDTQAQVVTSSPSDDDLDKDNNIENITRTYEHTKVKELLEAIGKLKSYAITLRDVEKAEKGKVAFDVAEELERLAKAYFQDGTTGYESEKDFLKDFTKVIDDNKKVMFKQRLAWSTLIMNVFIALSVVGLLPMGVKLVYSAITNSSHRPTFFGEKEITSTESLTNEVIKATEILLPSPSLL